MKRYPTALWVFVKHTLDLGVDGLCIIRSLVCRVEGRCYAAEHAKASTSVVALRPLNLHTFGDMFDRGSIP